MIKILVSLFLGICLFVSCKQANHSNKDMSQTEFDSLLSETLKKRQKNDNLIYITENQLDSIKANFRGSNKESLPLGINFGISEKAYKKIYNTLLNKGEIFQYSSSGIYAYKYMINDYRIWAIPFPEFEKGKMKSLKLICWDTDGDNSNWKLIPAYSKIYGKPFYIEKKDVCYWYSKGLEICLKDEIVNNDPYPSQSTGVLYYNEIK